MTTKINHRQKNMLQKVKVKTEPQLSNEEAIMHQLEIIQQDYEKLMNDVYEEYRLLKKMLLKRIERAKVGLIK